MRYLFIVLVWGFIFPLNAFAGEDDNCVLRIRTVMTDGAKKIVVKEVGATSHADCKAKAKEIEDTNREVAEIQKTIVTYSYKDAK